MQKVRFTNSKKFLKLSDNTIRKGIAKIDNARSKNIARGDKVTTEIFRDILLDKEFRKIMRAQGLNWNISNLYTMFDDIFILIKNRLENGDMSSLRGIGSFVLPEEKVKIRELKTKLLEENGNNHKSANREIARVLEGLYPNVTNSLEFYARLKLPIFTLNLVKEQMELYRKLNTDKGCYTKKVDGYGQEEEWGYWE